MTLPGSHGPASPLASSPPRGRVVFVGAGPGSADLITLRGARRLEQANVVLFDALIDPALKALAPDARWIDVGKRGFCDATGQARINALLVREARRHAVVVRLKGGDPSIFGRLEEELQALEEAGIDSEVVPGVTSALAAAADAKRPLTRRGRGRSVTLTTAMTQEHSLNARPRDAAHTAESTEVYYMAGRQLAALARKLVSAGWASSTPVLVSSRAGWPDAISSEHTAATLGEAALLHSGRPTVVTVGVGAQALPSTAKAIAADRGNTRAAEVLPGNVPTAHAPAVSAPCVAAPHPL
jgi:uroporphyrin-III C-methyltransferase